MENKTFNLYELTLMKSALEYKIAIDNQLSLDDLIETRNLYQTISKMIENEQKLKADDSQRNQDSTKRDELLETDYQNIVEFGKCHYEEIQESDNQIIYYPDIDDMVGYPPETFESYQALYQAQFEYRLIDDFQVLSLDDITEQIPHETLTKLAKQNPKFKQAYEEAIKERDLDNDGVPDRIDIDDSRNDVQDVKDLDEVDNNTDKSLKQEQKRKHRL